MKFKPGDKVSFLNETGGGVITRISDDVIYVTIEDGFEIPVMPSDIIKTGISAVEENAGSSRANPFSKVEETQETEDEDWLPLFHTPNSKEARQEGVYFAFVPEIPDNPLTGGLELYLMNNSEKTVLFNLYLNYDGGFHGIDHGFISERSGIYLDKINRTEIEKWNNALTQIIFFVDGKNEPMPPFSGLISFRPIKIYKEESFQYEPLIRKKAYILSIVEIEKLIRKSIYEEAKNEEPTDMLLQKNEPPQKHKRRVTEKKSFLDQHKIDDSIAEIDLHIGELIENFTNLEKSDMLRIQLDYVEKCIEQAKKERLHKLIFIHGIGNGILKNEIHKMLQRTHGIEFYDASYARYGMGATEVKFMYNLIK